MAPVPLDRPAWTEVVAVLVACTVLLVLLAKLDDSASRRHIARAAKAVKVDAGARQAAEAEEERWIIATSISPAIGVHRIVGPVVRVPQQPEPSRPASPARVEPVSYLAKRVDSPPSEPAPIPVQRLLAPAAAPAVAAPAPAPAPGREPAPPMPMLMIVAATGLTLVASGIGVLVRR